MEFANSEISELVKQYGSAFTKAPSITTGTVHWAARCASSATPGRNGPIRPLSVRVPSAKMTTCPPALRRRMASLIAPRSAVPRFTGKELNFVMSHPNGPKRNRLSILMVFR